MKVYGIKNCDTVKKAIKQLALQQIDYVFVDLKTADLSVELLTDWLSRYPEQLVNKRSTTYRQIKSDWLAADNMAAQIALLQAHPTLIKRPVLVDDNNELIIGFDMATYQALSD